MQTVGAACLMVSLGAGPIYVALTQTASALPFFVFALPAGAVGDIVDRRRLILYTEIWMVGVATVLAVATMVGFMSPWLLLVLTFALSAGDAMETPTWRAILPEMVKKEDLAAASALNGIEFNVARALGPALAGAIIAVAGVGTAFALNVVSFVGVIVLVARWKRPVRRRTTPPETLAGATVAALRYVRFSPSLRVLMLRSGVTMFFASVPARIRRRCFQPADAGAHEYWRDRAEVTSPLDAPRLNAVETEFLDQGREIGGIHDARIAGPKRIGIRPVVPSTASGHPFRAVERIDLVTPVAAFAERAVRRARSTRPPARRGATVTTEPSATPPVTYRLSFDSRS